MCKNEQKQDRKKNLEKFWFKKFPGFCNFKVNNSLTNAYYKRTIFSVDHGGERVDDRDVKVYSQEELDSLAQSADEALKMYDSNDDGYITYHEFATKML